MDLICNESDEHEKYYFGYSSAEIIRILRLITKNTIDLFMDKLEESCREDRNVLSEAFKTELDNLRELYHTKTTAVLKEFHIELKEMLSIPSNAPIYGQISNVYSDEDVVDLKKKLKELQSIHKRELIFHEILLKEMQLIEALKKSLPSTSDAKIDEVNNLRKFLDSHIKIFNEMDSRFEFKK